nr:hypothetical protein [uncultured Sphingorhabdus sp.]
MNAKRFYLQSLAIIFLDVTAAATLVSVAAAQVSQPLSKQSPPADVQ